MNCCSSRCGWCSRCDDGLREGDDPWATHTCDVCQLPLGWLGKVTIGGVGTFCGTDCAQIGVSRHELAILGKTRKAARAS